MVLRPAENDLEYVFAVAFQTVDINVVAEHERVGTAVQFQVFYAQVPAPPEDFVGVVHYNVLQVCFIHFAEHFRGVDNRIGHFQLVAVP